MYISTPPRLKIFKLKFTTLPGIEPRTCWTRGRHATIWANAVIGYIQDIYLWNNWSHTAAQRLVTSLIPSMTRPQRDNMSKWPGRGCLSFQAIHFANCTWNISFFFFFLNLSLKLWVLYWGYGTRQMLFPFSCTVFRLDSISFYTGNKLLHGSKFSCWLVYVLQCCQPISLQTVNVSLFLYIQL